MAALHSLKHVVAACACGVPLLVGCSIQHGADRPGEQPFDVIYSMRTGSSGIPNPPVSLAPGSYGWVFWTTAKSHFTGASGAFDPVHPTLRNWIATRDSTDLVEVVVCLNDSVRLPRMPSIDPRLPLNAPENVQAVAIGRHMADSVYAWRQSNQYALDTVAVRAAGAVRIEQTFWIARAMVVRVALGKIDQIEALPQVMSVEPAELSGKPPCPSPMPNGDATIRMGRDLLRSEPYAEFASGGDVALLDTGVRADHATFTTGAPVIGEQRDCVNDPDCNGTVVGDDCDGHGTKSASIIVGSGAGNDDFQGVTRTTLRSFRVWKPTASGSSECSFYTRKHWVADGLQAATHGGTTVVVEVDEKFSDLSFMATCADDAYDSGAIVVVAAGNDSTYGPTTPGNARRVMAVGAHDLDIHDVILTLSHGRTPDGRIKPDVLAPSGALAAMNSECDWDVFGFTSGAAPFGAAAALIARNWLVTASNNPDIDPGQVYAYMILCGDRPITSTTGSLDVLRGAGLVTYPTGGQVWFGKVTVSSHTDVKIPIDASSLSATTLDAALWWPQELKIKNHKRVDTHNDIDLELWSPTGQLVAASKDGPGVFERARASMSPGVPGKWIVRIVGNDFSTHDPQVVFWSAAATGSSSGGTATPGPSTSPLPSPSP